MWILNPDSFVSIVQSDDPAKLQVRARTKRHLVNFLGSSSAYEIVEDKRGIRDYRWRSFLTREQVGDLVKNQIMSIDYGNFKKRAGEKDKGLAQMASWWWHDHYTLQEKDKIAERRSKNKR